MLGEAAVLGEVVQGLFERRVGCGIVKIPLMVGETRGELVPLVAGNRAETGEFLETLLHFLTEFIVLFGAPGEAMME